MDSIAIELAYLNYSGACILEKYQNKSNHYNDMTKTKCSNIIKRNTIDTNYHILICISIYD